MPKFSSLSSPYSHYLIQYLLVIYMPFSSYWKTIGENNGTQLNKRRREHLSGNLGQEMDGGNWQDFGLFSI